MPTPQQMQINRIVDRAVGRQRSHANSLRRRELRIRLEAMIGAIPCFADDLAKMTDAEFSDAIGAIESAPV